MAFRCEITGKGPQSGNTISHSHRATKRRFLPNLQKIKVVINGEVKRIKVSTAAIKSGLITKAPSRAAYRRKIAAANPA
jgi:large subunit ribosomal protein L28